MRQIQIGSFVKAKGEAVLRCVRAIKDDHARCEDEGGKGRWFSLSQLSLTPAEPLKTYLL